mmetsp:Transcript_50138/g.92715  ORF Transcript_50138/g.92715 Transcript_50138/m.92715 type:complete len:203 (-) Transcript_50138:34-642(-)
MAGTIDLDLLFLEPERRGSWAFRVSFSKPRNLSCATASSTSLTSSPYVSLADAIDCSLCCFSHIAKERLTKSLATSNFPAPRATKLTASEYDGENCDTTGLISPVRTCCASSGPSNGVATITQLPSVSIPLLPALPAICNRFAVSRRFMLPPSPRLARAQITVVRAGMLIPAARVSVANTAFMSCERYSVSTKALCAANIPA